MNYMTRSLCQVWMHDKINASLSLHGPGGCRQGGCPIGVAREDEPGQPPWARGLNGKDRRLRSRALVANEVDRHTPCNIRKGRQRNGRIHTEMLGILPTNKIERYRWSGRAKCRSYPVGRVVNLQIEYRIYLHPTTY